MKYGLPEMELDIFMNDTSTFITAIHVFQGWSTACMSPIETWVAWIKVLKLFGPEIIFKICRASF